MLAGVVLLALVLSLTIRKDAPAIAFLLTLAAGILLLLRVGGMAGETAARFAALLSEAGLAEETYLPVVRATGVAAVVRVLAALCRDAGQSALAAKVEISGAALALGLCLPLLEQALALVTGWMG